MHENAHIEWAEKAALENLRGRIATGDWLVGQGNTLLTVLLVGVGGGLSYVVKLFTDAAAPAYLWGIAIATVWMAIVAAMLTGKVLATKETPAVFNEPKHLYRRDLKITLDELRVFELENLQGRIDAAKKRNKALASWLDRCRFAAIATPLVFTLAAACLAGR